MHISNALLATTVDANGSRKSDQYLMEVQYHKEKILACLLLINYFVSIQLKTCNHSKFSHVLCVRMFKLWLQRIFVPSQ